MHMLPFYGFFNLFWLFQLTVGYDGEFRARIEENEVAGCDVGDKRTNCLDDPRNLNFLTNEITLKDVRYDSTQNACCYKYRSVYTGNKDCNGDSPAQSHWTLDLMCPDNSFATVVSFTGTSRLSEGDDNSICINGVKFDAGCSGSESPCNYEVCIRYSNLRPGVCCTEPSWYAIKSGNAYSFGDIDAPSCICETDAPTDDPTENPTPAPTPAPTDNPTPAPTDDPTTDPTIDPTADPTADPTKDPTSDPTADPTKDPTSDPTMNPTLSPTPFCRPVVEVYVNEGCDAANLEALDTDVKYTTTKTYGDISELGYIEPVPTDELQQLVLKRSCDSDGYAAEAPFSEHNAEDFMNGFEKHGDFGRMPKNNEEYHDWIIALIVYSMTISGVLLVYCTHRHTNLCQRSDRKVKGKQISVYDSDDDDDEEQNENML